jgi:arylsulfatase A-like enzyme
MNRSRREFIVKSALGGLGGVVAISPFGKSLAEQLTEVDPMVGRRKNVLFLAVDDLRPELGCYGHPMVKSPNIDKLAKSGVTFDRTYCQQAVCGPTRASLLTGRRPDTTKVYDLKTHIRMTMPDVVTLQQHFKNNGYLSLGIGKLFHVNLEDEPSYSEPHVYPKGQNYALESNQKMLKEGGKVTQDTGNNAESTGTTRMRANATECAEVPDDTYIDGQTAVLGMEALQRIAGKAAAANEKERQPFFLGLGFRKPHLPFCAPKKYWDLYDRSKIPLPYAEKPRNAPDIAFTTWGELRSYSDIPDVGPCDEAKTRELIHGYYACVSYVDAMIGRVIDELDRLNLRKDTVIILWGDHVWKLGEYSHWSKHTNFELDTHVPMIISDPDHQKGVRVNALTEFVDIYPTLSELCGLPLPKGLEGTNMVPLLKNPKKKWKTAAFSQYPRPGNIMGYSMRTDRYRYTEWQDQKSGEVKFKELYDLKNDPLCKESIVFKPEHEKLIGELHEMMKAGWQKARP